VPVTEGVEVRVGELEEVGVAEAVAGECVGVEDGVAQAEAVAETLGETEGEPVAERVELPVKEDVDDRVGEWEEVDEAVAVTCERVGEAECVAQAVTVAVSKGELEDVPVAVCERVCVGLEVRVRMGKEVKDPSEDVMVGVAVLQDVELSEEVAETVEVGEEVEDTVDVGVAGLLGDAETVAMPEVVSVFVTDPVEQPEGVGDSVNGADAVKEPVDEAVTVLVPESDLLPDGVEELVWDREWVPDAVAVARRCVPDTVVVCVEDPDREGVTEVDSVVELDGDGERVLGFVAEA